MSKANKTKWQKGVLGLLNAVNDNNKIVSEMINYGFTENIVSVLFNIKYLNFNDEMRKALPDTNLQYSGGEGGAGFNETPLPSPAQLSNLFDNIFGTARGENATRFNSLLNALNTRANAINIETRRVERLRQYGIASTPALLNRFFSLIFTGTRGYFSDIQNTLLPDTLENFLNRMTDEAEFKEFISKIVYADREKYTLATRKQYKRYILKICTDALQMDGNGDYVNQTAVVIRRKLCEALGIDNQDTKVPATRIIQEMNRIDIERRNELFLIILNMACNSEDFKKAYAVNRDKYPNAAPLTLVVKIIASLFGPTGDAKISNEDDNIVIVGMEPIKDKTLLFAIIEVIKSFIQRIPDSDLIIRTKPFDPAIDDNEPPEEGESSDPNLEIQATKIYNELETEIKEETDRALLLKILTELIINFPKNTLTDKQALDIKKMCIELFKKAKGDEQINKTPGFFSAILNKLFENKELIKEVVKLLLIPSAENVGKAVNSIINDFKGIDNPIIKVPARPIMPATSIDLTAEEEQTKTLTSDRYKALINYLEQLIKAFSKSGVGPDEKRRTLDLISSAFYQASNDPSANYKYYQDALVDFRMFLRTYAPERLDLYSKPSEASSSSSSSSSQVAQPTEQTPISTAMQSVYNTFNQPEPSSTLQSNMSESKSEFAISGSTVSRQNIPRQDVEGVDLDVVMGYEKPPVKQQQESKTPTPVRRSYGTFNVDSSEVKADSSEVNAEVKSMENESRSYLRQQFNNLTSNFGTDWRLTRNYAYTDSNGRTHEFYNINAAQQHINRTLGSNALAQSAFRDIVTRYGLFRNVKINEGTPLIAGGGGGDDPPGPDDLIIGGYMPGDRFKGLTKQSWIKIMALIILLSTGAISIDNLIKGDKDLTNKGKVVDRPTEPGDKPKPDKPGPDKPTPGGEVFPVKYEKILHSSLWDSVGLGGVIDTYNSFVDEYNNTDLSKNDRAVANKKVNEYWGKLSKATGVPELNELLQARKTYDDLKKQYDNATANGLNFSNILGIYTALKNSSAYLDTMTQKYLNIENGIFGTAKSLTDADVTIDDKDDPGSIITKMQTQVKAKAIVDPSSLILSKGMLERIARKLANQGDFSSGIMSETQQFNNFSVVKNHEYPNGLGLDNPLMRRNKEYEINQYVNANPNPMPYIVPSYNKCLRAAKHEAVYMHNPIMIDDKLDDANWNPIGNQIKLKQPTVKSSLFYPENEIQKHSNKKKIETMSDMIRSGPYTDINVNPHHQGGTIQYNYNQKLNQYPITSEFKQVKPTKVTKYVSKVKKSRIPDNYSLK